jgi:hypothetical protein
MAGTRTMTRLRRTAALAVIALAGLPAAASAAVNCPAQPPTPLNAWAGSPKTLTIAAPCTTDIPGGAITYAAGPASASPLGTATVPSANGTFVFTGTFNPTGSDPTGNDTVNFTASDGTESRAVSVPISVNAAPVISTTFTGKDLETDTPLQDGRPTFDVFYKTLVAATSTLTDPTPVTPLAGFTVRFRSGVGAVKTSNPTNATGKAGFTFTPLVSDEYAFDVPALRGTFHDGFIFWVAPDWKIAKTFPVKNKKFVISGRLLAGKSVRKGSFVQFQRAKGTKWVTIVSRVPVTAALTFTVKVKRSAYLGKRVRFLYVANKNIDYIGSSFAFTIRAKKPKVRVVGFGARAAVSRALRG